MDIRIGEVITELSVTDSAGGLSAEEMRRLTATILEVVKRTQDDDARRARDTAVTDGFFQHSRL